MILHRSASTLHFHNLWSPSKFFSQFRYSSSLLCNFAFSSSSSLVSHRQSRSFGNPIAAIAERNEKDTFFAEGNVSWSSLGLSDVVSRALSNAGFEKPSMVQAASIPAMLSGKDVVIAAETGSGKTHSYLVPIIDKLYGGARDSCGNAVSDKELSQPRKILLVLCPNVLLCEQVVGMANGLYSDNGKPLVRVAAVCGQQGWPVNEPDVVVTTPAALLNYINPHKHRRMDFMSGVKYVVFDEADMLLCGGFQNKVICLINMLRYDEKLLSRSKEPLVELAGELGSAMSADTDTEHEEGELLSQTILEEEDGSEGVVNINNDAEDGSSKRRDWRRVRKSYERSKQYIFVAATLPMNGKKTAGAMLKRMFPDANWISGNYLHYHNPRLKQRWVEVTIDTQVDELIKAVNQGFRSEMIQNGVSVCRTMVFANTVEAVEAVVKILLQSGIECFRYHKDCSLEERAKALIDFREKGGVLVCTDAAARGVDIPNVSHVIQADFASSAVDFLHRVGRTARAGQFGLVTNMFTKSNQELVDAVCRAAKLGQPVETAFSRKRSFRNKLKKRGLSKVGDSAGIKESVVDKVKARGTLCT